MKFIFGTFLFGVILRSKGVGAFNIDLHSRLVITNNFDGPNSYFGTTVELVSGKNTGSGSKSSWIIIGAPKANSKKWKNIQEPGVVWRCSLGKQNGDSCDILEMNNHGNEMQSHHAPGEEVLNRKDGGFFGGSMSLGQDRFVSCASRWANQRANNISYTSHYLMNGLCYWRPKVQIVEDFLPELATNHTLIPLRNKDRQGFRGKQGFDWSFGQAGFSVHVSDGMETILGAPGVNDWKGTVIQLRDSTDPRLRRNGAPEDFGTFFQAPQLVAQPHLETYWKQNATYFGYAVTSGKYLEVPDDAVQYVASAPRGGFQNNLTGHILLFTFPESDRLPLNILQKFEGPSDSASYFGSVLCTVDLNGDGWSDLLIGAPLYIARRTERMVDASAEDEVSLEDPVPESDFTGHGDEGAVFVYISEKDKLSSRGFVYGNNKPWSRFGSAIASIGDINRDGYNDVAIGAPYEDSRRGAVYIYHGSALGLTRKFAQVIHASDLDSKLAGFGISLSPGTDVDGNGYNDLAIGAYFSAQVVILRTSPVVVITANLSSITTKIPINRKDFTFKITSCVAYESKDAISDISVKVKIMADVNSIITRMYLTDGDLPPAGQIEYDAPVKYGSLSCRDFTAIVKQRLTLSGQRVLIRQEVSIIDRRNFPNKSTDYTIVPLTFGATVPRTEHNGTAFNSFCKNCPVTEQNVTKFDLPLDPAVLCGDDDICVADLEVTAQFSNYSNGESFVIGSEPKLHLSIQLRNEGETAIYPKLIMSWLRLSLVTMPSDCGQSTVRNPFVLTCSLGQTLEKGQVRTLELEFDMSDLMAGEQNGLKEFVLNIEATTTSNLLNPGKILSLILPFEAQAKIDMLATVTILNITTLNPYNVFTHSYLLKLEGPSTIKTTELQFDIPQSIFDTPQNNMVVNVTHVDVKQDGDEIVCSGPDSLSSLFSLRDPDVDGLDEVPAERLQQRLKRSVSKTKKAGIIKDNTLLLNCNQGLVECFQVVCLVHKFIPGTRVTVDITFRMSKNKAEELLETYAVQNIEYRTKAKITMLNVDITVLPKEAVTRLQQIVVANNTIVWVASSIAAGLFLILCIGLILYFCGVFDRKKIRPEDMEEEFPMATEATPLQEMTSSDVNPANSENPNPKDTEL